MHLTLALPALNQPDFAKLPRHAHAGAGPIVAFSAHSPRKRRGRLNFTATICGRAACWRTPKRSLVWHRRAAAFATPVWQQMGMHSMSMLAARYRHQYAASAAALRGLDDFYQADGWRFLPVRADLWLLVLPALPDWQVPPLPMPLASRRWHGARRRPRCRRLAASANRNPNVAAQPCAQRRAPKRRRARHQRRVAVARHNRPCRWRGHARQRQPVGAMFSRPPLGCAL